MSFLNPLEWLVALFVGFAGLLPAIIAAVIGRLGRRKSAQF
jgi:hypothetical protein